MTKILATTRTARTVTLDATVYADILDIIDNLAEGWASYDDEPHSREGFEHFKAVRRAYKKDARALIARMPRCLSDNADECTMLRERAAAGLTDDVPGCPEHGETLLARPF